MPNIEDSSPGVVTLLTNSTEMMKFLNPNGKVACSSGNYSGKNNFDINTNQNYSSGTVNDNYNLMFIVILSLLVLVLN
ncbi:16685_t:CDS:2 [Entrophospora sp. SA101]|nr:5941_t:CDS:2 [Entrophospora sp. SA101]CAJ0625555.1 3313_t:CDS:2 [Entrophospora sp. SA101]CAJ0633183.1 16685_t:CDS:2 [Entrophospora sp. SA101]CAJ0825402.1 1800_t:CDS:2 [Entrophospora sp. SA101]